MGVWRAAQAAHTHAMRRCDAGTCVSKTGGNDTCVHQQGTSNEPHAAAAQWFARPHNGQLHSGSGRGGNSGDGAGESMGQRA
jgi:hypothetical protein